MKSLTMARPSTARRSFKWRESCRRGGDLCGGDRCGGHHARADRLARGHLDPAGHRDHLGAAQSDPAEADTPQLHRRLPALQDGDLLEDDHDHQPRRGRAPTLALGAPAAYAMSRFTFFGGRAMYGAIIFFRMIPPVAAIVPLFMVFDQFHLLGSYQGLIIAHTAFKLPVAIWLLRNFFMDVPRELDDSARVDGCFDAGGPLADRAPADPAGAGRDGGAVVPLDLERPADHPDPLDAHRDPDAAARADEVRPRIRRGLGLDDRRRA